MELVDFYDKVIEKNLGQTILLVSHGGLMISLMVSLAKEVFTLEGSYKYHPKNCAVTILEVDDNKEHKVKLLNCVEHL